MTKMTLVMEQKISLYILKTFLQFLEYGEFCSTQTAKITSTEKNKRESRTTERSGTEFTVKSFSVASFKHELHF